MNRRQLQDRSREVEEVLDEFAGAGDDAALERAERLVRSLMGLYATGLGRILEVAEERDPGLLRALADDDAVGSLLVLHDLHPDDVDTRIQGALDRVRPYLGSHAGGIEYLGVDADGVAHLTLQGSCHGCPSSAVTVTTAVEGAILEAAPEVTAVDVVGVVADTSSPLLQIGLRPGLERAPTGAMAGAAVDDGGWARLDSLPPRGTTVSERLNGDRVLVVNLGGAGYAYRDVCPRCSGSLVRGALDGDVLACPSCQAGFDVRLAGRGLDTHTGHLSPLPMLPEGSGWTVAVPGSVPA
jgi:Fe-S cluster biogenesis protein NfuA/nitrite reductase/ring-hydroxylating ferredoxin subunit